MDLEYQVKVELYNTSIRDTEMKYLSEPERILRFWENKGISHDEEYRKAFINSYQDRAG